MVSRKKNKDSNDEAKRIIVTAATLHCKAKRLQYQKYLVRFGGKNRDTQATMIC